MKRLLHHANQLICISTNPKERCKHGRDMHQIEIIEHGSLLMENDTIAWIGHANDIDPNDADECMDVSGKTIIPGLIDPHTHAVFGGSREHEFAQRASGVPYLEIAKQGGGINASVRMTRQASLETLTQNLLTQLDFALEWGITTMEVKSGYGLNTEVELRMLEAIRCASKQHPMTLVPTFLGAHEIPFDCESKEAYIENLINEMLPKVEEQQIAEFCDVFCEDNVYSVAESERILTAGKNHSLKPKVHADEFVGLGGAEMAAHVGAVSADHLLKISHEGMNALKQAGTIAVILPGTAFYLKLEYAPVHTMLEADLPLALASDFNPGSCVTQNLPLILTMACTQMNISPETALTAATLNAAAAIDRSDELGSLAVGKKADCVLLNTPNFYYFLYHYGINHVDAVYKNGTCVVRNKKTFS